MIEFDVENVDMPSLDYEMVREWIESVASNYGYRVGRLSYLFCSDDDILRYNNQYLGHDYFTDIITFDYTSTDRISGDIIISLDTVRSNAELFSQSYNRELLRVLIHGVLHLCGINDKGPGEREIMEAAEEDALKGII